jgi:hypothetical protein
VLIQRVILPQPDEANAPEDGEFFNFNVFGSESDGPVQPTRQPHRQAQGATEVDQQINDLTPVQNLKKAGDTCHFFERQGDSNVCKVCK